MIMVKRVLSCGEPLPVTVANLSSHYSNLPKPSTTDDNTKYIVDNFCTSSTIRIEDEMTYTSNGNSNEYDPRLNTNSIRVSSIKCKDRVYNEENINIKYTNITPRHNLRYRNKYCTNILQNLGTGSSSYYIKLKNSKLFTDRLYHDIVPKYLSHYLFILLLALFCTVSSATPLLNSTVQPTSASLENFTNLSGSFTSIAKHFLNSSDSLFISSENGSISKLILDNTVEHIDQQIDREDLVKRVTDDDDDDEEEYLPNTEHWYLPQGTNEEDFEKAIGKSPTAEEQEKIDRFNPSRINYTVFREVIDNDLQDLSLHGDRFTTKLKSRKGRSLSRHSRLLSNLGRMFELETVINEIETSIMTTVSCNACIGGVGLLQSYIDGGKTPEEIIRAASKLCTNFKVETPRVCFGIINLMAEEVVYVIKNLPLEPDNICGFLIGDVCGTPPDPFHRWRVLFPPYPKPPTSFPKPPNDNVPTLKVLHLSDTHFDPYYKEGSNAECGEPMCCRATSGKPKTLEARAGFWGDYRKCDTPLRTIESMFQNIALKHKDIDYILWTGDLPPHDIWNQTRDSNIKVLRETVQQLFDYFPNTPVYPALGNHESAPVNSFPPLSVPQEHSAQWLYDELDVQWRKWLPDYTSNTIRKGGFYAVEVSPGFRIISLNMNFCNNKNWWLLLDSTDPADQLQWLVYELQSSELKGEKVHIIGHIPPGYHDCLKIWSHNFYNIVNRYEDTITGQFYGHTHFDEFELFYDPFRRYRVTNIAYIAPSQSSYYQLNPGYRLYVMQGEYDGSQKRVIDHETWVMNLDEANHPNNIIRTPRWYPLYSARRAFGMRSLLPVDWDNLVYRMAGEEKLFDKFYRFYWKNSPIRPKCDNECRKRILCDLKSGRSNARKHTCAKVHERVEAQERSSWKNWIFSGITVTSLATIFMWG